MPKQDTGHPDVPEDIFDEEDRTEEELWQIYLNAVHPAEVHYRNSAISNEEYSDDLDELDLIPESVLLDTVSFYFKGTFREAYIRAQEMCDELNENRYIDESEWEFESGNIMVASQ